MLRIKYCTLIVIGISLSQSTYSTNPSVSNVRLSNIEFRKDTVCTSSDCFTLMMPEILMEHSSTQYYTEGMFITYPIPLLSQTSMNGLKSITIFSGGCNQINLPSINESKIIYQTDSLNQWSTSSTKYTYESKYFREDRYPGFRIFYENLDYNESEIADSILNSFQKIEKDFEYNRSKGYLFVDDVYIKRKERK